MSIEKIKQEIIEVLNHPEADEGLFFRNFAHLHEEDDREPVNAPDDKIASALNELVLEKKVVFTNHGDQVIFILAELN